MTRIIRHKIKLKTHREKVKLVTLGCIHRANRNCDVKKLNETYKWIKENDCYVIGMGDYSEWITPRDKRYDINSYFPELIHPDAQEKELMNKFKKFKKKIITLLDGNHEFSINQYYHHNYIDSMAKKLGTEYGTIDTVIRLEFEREGKKKRNSHKIIDIYAHHGWSNARSMGGRVNRIQDLYNIFPDLDLYLMGHVHLLGSVPPKISLKINKVDQIVEKQSNFAFTGSYLRGYVDYKKKPVSTYVARKTYIPTTLGSLLIEIQPFRNAGHAGQDKTHIEIKPLVV